MYDRKTWIVVGICAVLLALNFHYGNKRAAEAAKQRQAEQRQAAPPAEPGEVPEQPGVLEEVEPTPAEVLEAQTYTLETEKTVFTLTTLGGGVETAELKDQASLNDPDTRVTLNDGSSSAIGSIAEGPDRMERVNYRYLEGESQPGQRVVFAAKHPSGLVVKKTWSLTDPESPGADYLLDFTLEVQNSKDSTQRLPLETFSLFLGEAGPLHKGEGRLTPSGFFWRDDGDFHLTKASKFTGGMFSDDQALIAETVPEIEYAGVSNQFFATLLKPAEVSNGGVWAKPREIKVEGDDKPGIAVRAGMVLPSVALEPGSASVTLNYQLFMGPKENRMLNRMGEGWGDLMNYGWAIIGVFSWMLNYALVYIHDVVAKVSGPWSWGIAIVVVTLVVRTMMWPLYARSNRTMKRMGKLKPEMDRLKEKYPDDPAKMQQEVMGLYRKYGINPVGGCLPMLAQMPIFFGFYRMLQYAVELRGHGFLWVDDLSMPDTVGTIAGFPINVLPIIMGLSSFAQMAMMPNTSGDKTQMAIMKMMPLIFLVFCYNFAAALALYWTTSNLFSIFQTWLTKRMPEPELKERKGPPKKSFMERMAAAAEQQQKMKQARGRVVDDEKSKPKKPRGPRTGG
ncbi:membrane protein insertase YidC [Haloferula sp. A504]|uniref:membrane protein insertase YidC n=1 Tax=Haloferula sp. A504 TaxID=3373601 RepID=UPI0031C3B3AD|nr:membrane protein insertase YidC [Verrucomicrobiaceae bacterium E54]